VSDAEAEAVVESFDDGVIDVLANVVVVVVVVDDVSD
jgi:hypothetical protein